jgi:hypothetical protein
MIYTHFDTKIFTAVENEDNGNVEVYLKKDVREKLGIDYPHIAVEVRQGNPMDSGIGIDQDCIS